MQVDRHNPVPIYYQLQQEIRRRIETQEWRPGDQLPSERKLAEDFAISHMTVRQALSVLINEGLLERRRGRGTFVAEPKIHKPLVPLTSFTEFMKSSGKRPGARVLNLKQIPAPESVAKILGVPTGAPIIFLERLRTADDEVLGIEKAHLHFAGCAGLLREDLTRSLYELLRTKYGIIPTIAEETIEAISCPAREAKLLGIKSGQPSLHISRHTLSQDGQPIEVVDSIYRGDKYVIHARLTLGIKV